MSVLRVEKRNDLAEVAEWLDVDQKTIRRWCEKGIVPGAYRTSGGIGHWRIRNPIKASIALMECPPVWHRQRKSFNNKQANQSIPTLAQLRQEHSNPNSPDNLARQIYFAHNYGVMREEIIANKFRGHTSEMRHDLSRISISELNKKIPQAFWRIAQSPDLAHLYLAASKLRFHQLPCTRISLAKELGISRASLYRKYSSTQINGALDSLRGMKASPFDASPHAESVREAERNVYRLFRRV